MECNFCKDIINDGSSTCKVCGEILGARRKWRHVRGFFAFLLSMLVPIGSLGIAYLEYNGRIGAEDAKVVAERKQEITADILRGMPKNMILDSAKEDLKYDEPIILPHAMPQESAEKVEIAQTLVNAGNAAILKGNYENARKSYEKVLKQNPEEIDALRGMIYSDVLER